MRRIHAKASADCIGYHSEALPELVDEAKAQAVVLDLRSDEKDAGHDG